MFYSCQDISDGQMLQPGYSCWALLQPQHPMLAFLISQIKRVNSLRMNGEKTGKMAEITTNKQQKLSSQIT